MTDKGLILCAAMFLILMSILVYVEFGVNTSSASASQNTTEATITEATASVEPNGAASAEKEIRAIVEKYYEIAHTGDREALKNFAAEISAPEYLYSSELGTLDKTETLRLFDSERSEFWAAHFDDFEAQALDRDTVIAKYRELPQAQLSGERLKSPMRFTNVWTRRDGKWLVVAEHSSTIVSQKLLPRHPLADNLARKK